MILRYLTIIPMLVLFSLSPVLAQDSSPDAGDFRQVLYELSTNIEEAFGIEPRASQFLLDSGDAEMEKAFDYIEDKEGFFLASGQILSRIESTKLSAAEEFDSTPPDLTAADAVSEDLYPPNYPPDEGWYHYNIIGPLRVMGATQNVYDRCHDFDNLPWPEELVFDLEQAAELGDAYCQAAGCDPFGILVCAETCVPVTILKLALWVIKLPIEMCKYHDGKVDAAEIEAAYENGVNMIQKLGSTDGKIDALSTQLTTHDTQIKAELTALKSMLETVLSNQQELIELLNTPQGRRQDWNSDKKN
jgi:hypothetical protein